MDLAPGVRLGSYELRSKLGEGGMGEVWRARDVRLGRDVAIKMIPSAFAADAERLRRFEQEARTASSLNHPNLLTLFDVGTEQGSPYLVTELLEGETLHSRLAAGALPWREGLELGVQILRGLAAAHEGGIVHRDLKPENLFLTKDGRAKILDFGLARLHPPTGGAASRVTSAPTVERTEAGTLLGTVGYMAPEQVRGEPADARSDLFAFGCVLLEMLTGQRAFRREVAVETMSAILREEPAGIGELEEAIPAGVVPVLRRCLEKDPAKRFQSAADLAFALTTFATDGPGALAGARGGPRRPRVSERIAWGLAALGVLAAVGLAVFTRPGDAPPPAVLHFEVPTPAPGGFEKGIALSPDGSRLAFVAPDPSGQDVLWVRRLAAFEPRPLLATGGAAYPFWSPDGARIGFFAGGQLQTIDAAGESAPQVVCRAAAPRGGAWSGSGEILFAPGVAASLFRVPAAGGEPQPATRLGDGSGASHRWPSFLPDGRRFLYSALEGGPETFGVWLGSLDSSETSRLLLAESGAIFTAPGHLLFRREGRLLAQPFDPKTLRLAGAPRQVGEAVWWDGVATTYAAFTASATGTFAYRPGGLALSRLVWFDREGRDGGSVGLPGAYLEPALSPDGRRLAVAQGGPGSPAAIWVFDLERGTQSRLSSSAPVAVTPLWSADGRRIAYTTFPEGQVYARDSSGGGVETHLAELGDFSPLDDWSRDGRTLLYETLTTPPLVMALDLGGESRPRTVVPGDGGRLSPDGDWIAYTSSQSGVPEIFVQRFAGAGERVQASVAGGTQPRWRGDGRELFYVAPDRKLMAVEVTPGPSLEVGPPRALFSTQILPLVEARNHYDVTPDGQRFLVNSRSAEDAMRPVRVVVGWSEEIPR